MTVILPAPLVPAGRPALPVPAGRAVLPALPGRLLRWLRSLAGAMTHGAAGGVTGGAAGGVTRGSAGGAAGGVAGGVAGRATAEAAGGVAGRAAGGVAGGAADGVADRSGTAPTGGPPAINELFHARRLGLVRLAVLLVDDLPTAEDIVQDVFAALYRRHGPDLRSIADPHAYLTAGVMNAARSVLRRRRTARAYLPPPAATAPAAEDQALLREGDRRVLAALGGLTVRQRQVVVLRYWSDLTEQEIADVLRISRGTVKSTASRALAALRERLADRR
jgi:RNA polymerase sigma-70 factor (sigma-E family)